MLALYYKADPFVPVFVDMPHEDAVRTAKHVNTGGLFFETAEGVFYPCAWMVQAAVYSTTLTPPENTPPTPPPRVA